MAAGLNVAPLSVECFDPGNLRADFLWVASFGMARGRTEFGKLVSTAMGGIGQGEILQLGGKCTSSASLSPVRTDMLICAACGIGG